MNPVAIGQVFGCILAQNIEPVGVFEARGVAVGCAVANEYKVTLVHLEVAELAVVRRNAPHILGGRREARNFFDHVGQEPGVFAHQLHLVRVLNEQEQTRGDRRRRSFVPGD